MSFLVEIADEEYKNKNKFIEIIKTVIEFLKIKKFKRTQGGACCRWWFNETSGIS